MDVFMLVVICILCPWGIRNIVCMKNPDDWGIWL